MKIDRYLKLKNEIIQSGYKNEILMINKMLDNPCNDSERFFREYVWVVVNAGMKYQIADIIYQKIIYALNKKYKLENIFGHVQKVEAIKYVQKRKKKIFNSYYNSNNKIEFLECLPFIGPTTKFHFARNLGLDVCKPDRHLRRIAGYYKLTPDLLCKMISEKTHDRVGVVDVVLWRAGNLQLI